MKFVSPKSFTGEDSIEINCHGNLSFSKEGINYILKSKRLDERPLEANERKSIRHFEVDTVEGKREMNLISRH